MTVFDMIDTDDLKVSELFQGLRMLLGALNVRDDFEDCEAAIIDAISNSNMDGELRIRLLDGLQGGR